jgi:hypothetical protein
MFWRSLTPKAFEMRQTGVELDRALLISAHFDTDVREKTWMGVYIGHLVKKKGIMRRATFKLQNYM